MIVIAVFSLGLLRYCVTALCGVALVIFSLLLREYQFPSCVAPQNGQDHLLKQKACAMMPHSTRSLGEGRRRMISLENMPFGC